MSLRFCVLHISALCVAASFAASSAHAQARVGEAAVVKNEVVRVMGSASSQINVGDGVLRDEIVRTGLDSAARLVMADSTNLSLGPSATIKLDRTVFNDEHTYRDIAIRLTTGAFRFVTGHSEKTAYKITTSVATITLTGGKAAIEKTNNSPWTFAATCGAAAGLCTATNFADATPLPMIPPACCAGADHGQIHNTELYRIGRTHRVGLACAGTAAAITCIGAVVL